MKGTFVQPPIFCAEIDIIDTVLEEVICFLFNPHNWNSSPGKFIGIHESGTPKTPIYLCETKNETIGKMSYKFLNNLMKLIGNS